MMTQLDLECAKAGERLARIDGVDEKLLNSALAVLQEQGVYACFLYLRAQGNDPGKEISYQLYQFLSDLPALNLEKVSDKNGVLSHVTKLAENLDSLLFARELLLQVLMYARYHLKLKSGGSA